MNVLTIPGCTFSAASGERRADEAKAKEPAMRQVGRFPFPARQASLWARPTGFVKTVFGQTGELLGAPMIGAEVTD